MNLLRIFFWILYLSPTPLLAQICGFSTVKNADIERYTEGYVSHFLQSNVQQRTIARIPVVVHVVWNSGFENISDAQIQSQIEALNRDFRKRNTVNPVFSRFAVDCEIEFCLAQRDTNGNPTTGIVRRQTNYANIGSEYFDTSSRKRIYYTSKGGSTAWNPQKYLNIWVCSINVLYGFASSPAKALERPEEDGVVVDYRVFGTTGSLREGRQNGRLTVHEIGHYFNLLHIWGSDSTCVDDDEVTDTPVQASPHEGCPVDLVKSCNNSLDYFRNYMDYTNDDCMSFFTAGQKARMWATLTGFRANLISSNVCDPVSVQTVNKPIFEVFPNPAQTELTVIFKNQIASESKTIQLLDCFGRIVLEKRNYTVQGIPSRDGVFNLSLNDCPNGFYWLSIQVNNQNIVKKVVIQK
ncbi:MAG: T9SS type A sorting domain-containing protein [Saprospiraceae bacterium]|nr:T9SS type A sorting domain-containing protein [Saprospiraceae bacterium]